MSEADVPNVAGIWVSVAAVDEWRWSRWSMKLKQTSYYLDGTAEYYALSPTESNFYYTVTGTIYGADLVLILDCSNLRNEQEIMNLTWDNSSLVGRTSDQHPICFVPQEKYQPGE